MAGLNPASVRISSRRSITSIGAKHRSGSLKVAMVAPPFWMRPPSRRFNEHYFDVIRPNKVCSSLAPNKTYEHSNHSREPGGNNATIELHRCVARDAESIRQGERSDFFTRPSASDRTGGQTTRRHRSRARQVDAGTYRRNR